MKQNLRNLFQWQRPYDHQGTSRLFMQAVRENLAFQEQHCGAYRKLLRTESFQLELLRREADLARIPAIPTVYFKHHKLLSVDAAKLKITARSSGTSGKQSFVGFDQETCRRAAPMLVRFFHWHGLISPIPANYFVLGTEPQPGQQIGAYKTLRGAMKLAPAVQVRYLNQERGTRLTAALDHYEKKLLPVRFIGFPVFLESLLGELECSGRRYHFAPGSRILIGGGFKRQSKAAADDRELKKKIRDYLGIRESHIHEFFSATEHPIPYLKCRAGHFHIPVYSRVIIRDFKTLKPLPYGRRGLLNLLTPLVQSMPLASVITDDFAVLYPGGTCSCNNPAPYFRWLGRAGVDDIRTCAVHGDQQGGGTT